MSELTKKAALEELRKLAEQVFLNERKVYTVGNLKQRFLSTAEAYRQDQTIQQVARVIATMADKNPITEVTSNDIHNMMNTFYVPNTNFRQEFGDLLEEEQVSTRKQSARLDFHGDYRALDELSESVAEVDETDLNSLDHMSDTLIDPSLEYSTLDEPTIRYAATLVEEEIKNCGIKKSGLQLKYKTPDMLVYKASLRTAAGEVEVFIPVELKDNNPLIPQVMSTTDSVYTLDVSGIQSLSQDFSKKALIHKAQSADKMRMDMGMYDEMRSDSIGSVEVDEFEEYSQKEVHLGVDEIETILKDAVIRKESKFGISTIDYGRDLVAVELNDIGYKNSQVQFAGDTENGLLYDAVINTDQGKFKIQVPVEASKGMLLTPSEFISSDKGYLLSQASLRQAVKDGNPQENIHPLLYSMSYQELKKQLKESAYQHKPQLAKQVIAMITEKFDEYYQNAAIDDYQTWLTEATASYEARCNGCDYYHIKNEKTADWCGLIKSETKEVFKDASSGICTRSIFSDEETPDIIAVDSGNSIKL